MQERFRDTGMSDYLVSQVPGNSFRSAAPENDPLLQVEHAQADRQILQHVAADLRVFECSHVAMRYSNAPMSSHRQGGKRLNPQARGTGRTTPQKGPRFETHTGCHSRAGHGRDGLWSEGFRGFIFDGEQFLGEGCPGVLDWNPIQGARHFGQDLLFAPASTARTHTFKRVLSWDLVGRNREVDRNLSLRLHGVGADVVRFEMPLSHCFLCGPGQDRRPAYDSQFLNQAIAADYCVQDY